MKKLLVFLSLSVLLGVRLPGADGQQLADQAARYQSGDSGQALGQLEDLLREISVNPQARDELETALIRMLQPDATHEARLFACQRLAIVGTDRSLPALGTLLTSEETVGMACLALGSYPRGKADRRLRDALGDLRGNARVQVIATLGHRRDTAAARALGRLAHGPDLQAAEAAVVALGRLANGSARRTLATLRESDPEELRLCLDEASLLEAESLAADGKTKAAQVRYEELLKPSHAAHIRAGALVGLLGLEPRAAAARLHEIIRGEEDSLKPDDALRPVALAAVSGLQSSTAGLLFAGELDRLPEPEQVLLVQALAGLGKNCPRSALAVQLKSDSPNVRLAVIEAFASLNDPEDIAVFVRALSAAQTPVERKGVEQALVMLPGGGATDDLLLAALSATPPENRVELLNALARRGSPRAVPVLFEAAGSSEATVARSGLQGLGRLAGPAELPALMDLYVGLPEGVLRDEAEGTLARILGRMPDAAGRAQAVCAKLETASSLEARLAFIRILPLAGGQPALEAVRAAMTEDDERVRDAGVRALGAWADVAASEDLMAVYAEPSEATHRTLALRGLMRLAGEANGHPDEGLVARYRQLLEIASSDDDRRLILGALGGCGHPGALELALEQRSHGAVRAEADQAVKRIADTLKAAHPELAEEALKQVATPMSE